jgi:hypothetical protein
MGTPQDTGNLAPGECVGLDTSTCGERPNASPAGCVLGKCAYECNAGFADDNRDLSDPEGDGCEGTCVPTNGGVELCDDIDNDCDGETDEDFQVNDPCGVGVGACRSDGVVQCDGPMSSSCNATPDAPTTEVCDGADNDCDGSVDEDDPDVGNACMSGESGICGPGIWQCQTGMKTCVPNEQPGNEVCDGVDNDCDGDTDEGNPGGGGACNTGLDGICAAGTEVCDGAGGYTCEQQTQAGTEDCGADNTGNGLDDDCDGQIDEGCAACVDGQSRPCYTGPAGTQNVGACTGGTQNCSGGTWSACNGEVVPRAETCNGADDNCNGSVDEDFGNKGQSCTVGQGECAASGTFVCNGSGTGTVCNGTAGSPSTEVCDGVDNDCDGQTDENLTRSCGSSVGACTTGTETCVSGAWGTCVNAQGPQPERCNGIDDNCNGQTDETFAGLGSQCAVGVGACERDGAIVCNGAGTGTVCDAQAGNPTGESCNGIDDNCNGQIDENITQPCGTNTGACVAGTRTCNNGSFGSCVGSTGPSTETCDGVDNDCDGQTDEGCDCINGTTRNCYSGPSGTAGVGICRQGSQTCSGGSWGACSGQVTPRAEECNNADDDCDGNRDEGLTRTCGISTGACSLGTETCNNGSWGSCTGGTSPTTEVCDGVDNDCDGSTDEGLRQTYYFDSDRDGYGTSVAISACGPTGDYQATVSGDCNDNNSSVNPGEAEVCFNSLDNDCDGLVACADPECNGQPCSTNSALGTCTNGSCSTGGSCGSRCGFDQYCQFCGGPGDDICCDNGQFCLCP